MSNLENFTDFLENNIENSPPISLPASDSTDTDLLDSINLDNVLKTIIPSKRTGELGDLRSVEEIDPKYRHVFSYQYFNLVQSKVIEDALYSDKSMVVCAPTGSGKTVVFEMAIVQLLAEMDNKNCAEDFKIIYMAPIKALCTERLTEWYPKFTRLNLLCIEVTGDTDVDFSQLKPYRIIITTPEKWDMLTRRWRDNRAMVEVIKLFLIDEVHILNDANRGPVLEAVVSRMKTIQSSVQSAYRIEQLLKHNQRNIKNSETETPAPQIRFVAVSATVSNPEDVAEWLGTSNKPAVYYKFGDECRPVKLNRLVEGYSCPAGTSVFKFDIILNYKLWPLIQKYHNGKPTLIFCNTRKSVILTAETLSRAITINFNPEQKAKLVAVASAIKNKKIQSLILCGVGCHHAGLLFEERTNIENAFRNGDLPILITTTTLAMGVNLPAHLVIVKNTQQYVNGAYQEYSISTVLQMVGRAGRPQFDTEATAVIMTRLSDKARYQALVGGCEPLQSYLHKRLAENLNSEAALGTVNDVAQCVQWLRSTFLFVRAARDPKKYLGLPQSAPQHLITKKIEDLCIIAMNSLASSGLIKMDEVSCIESTEAGRLLSIYYLDLETMKNIMKIKGNETVEQLLWIVCESHELSDMHLRVDERRCLNALNRNNAAATIRFPMKGKISNRQMKLNCLIQAVLGCLPILEPSLNQEAIKVMRIADRICKCIAAYVTRPNMLKDCPQNYGAVLNSLILAKCLDAHLWENSIYVSKQLKGIGPTFSTLLATAGKINFMLLEESHPRDLERIMNKGPPAGNVLRKQISLLPKYQLTMTAIDENSVKLHLILLNQMHLAENIEQLTAGPHHKCYIIVGDTENHLLLLSFFKDKDLINIHDGQISHNIIRRHKFEHKIIAHCISTSFVGIDVQSEYIFNSLEMLRTETGNKINYDGKARNKHVKQSAITDTFNVRKRKNYENGEICPTENRKRDLPVIERLKYLNQSFIGSHKNISKGMKKDIVTLGESLNQCAGSNSNFKKSHTLGQTRDDNAYCTTTASVQNYRETNIEDDVQINKILKEIENEKSEPNKSSRTQFNRINIMTDHNEIANNIYDNKMKKYSVPECKKKKSEISNFDVVINIEKKANLFDELEDTMIKEENTFANTVKRSIDQYLEQTKSNANPSGNIASKINTKNKINPTGNKDTSKYDINIISSSKIKPDIDDTLEYCEDMFTGNTLNIIQSNNAEFIFDSEHDTHKDLPLDVLSTEEKQNNEIDCIQNNNNCSIKELRPDYVSLPSCNDEVLIFHDIESLNTKLNHKLNSESILNFKVNCMKNFNSVLNGNKYSIPIPLMDPLRKSKDFLPIHSYLIKTQGNNEGVLSFNNDVISIGNDKTRDIEKLSPRTSCNTPNQSLLRKTHIDTDNLEQNFNQDNSNIPLSDSTKKLSYSKTHVNLYNNKNADSNYCLIRKVKINVDVIETLYASKEEDAVVMIENESNDNGEETKYVTLETKQYKPSANYLPSLKSNTNPNQDDHNNIFINLNETPNEDLKHDNGKCPEKFKKYAQKPFPLSPVFSQQNSTVKGIIQKYKDIFSREVKSFNQQDRQPSLAPGNDTKNVNQNKKYKRQYSITNLPNPNIQSSSQINLQHGISRLNEKKPDNFKSNNIDIPKHERDEDEFLLNFINIDLPPKLSPTIGSGSPQCDLIPQAINSDCDLNQSMFNPRTLLETLNENDVIPPAPQFRDEINISPNPDNTLLEAKPNSPNYIFKEDNTLDLDNVNYYNEYKKTKLTPKKIETWTLARDNVDTELPKSVIICNNKANNRFLAMSRKSKLQNFKYSRKNFLKHRK